jgi:tetratricopeptide (TPR) repeat protein
LLDAIGQFAAALEHEQIAVSQDPLAPNPRYMLGILLDSVRRHAEAARVYEKVVATAPAFAYSYEHLAISRLYAGDNAGAQADARIAAEKTGEDVLVAASLMTAVADPSRRAQVLPMVKDVHRLCHVELGGLARAFWYAQLGAPEQAIAELQQWTGSAAQGERFNGLRYLWMPAFDLLRGDVRFKALLTQFGLPDLGVDAIRDSGTKFVLAPNEPGA